MTSTPDTVVVPRTMLLAMREYIALDNNPKSNRILSSIAAALSASEPVAYLYERAMGMTVSGEPDCWQTGLTFVNPDRHSGIRNVRPLFTHPAPSVSPSVETIAAAYVAGALAVHNEWLAAAERGDDPPRGDPEFSEAANDYAQSIAALFEGGK